MSSFVSDVTLTKAQRVGPRLRAEGVMAPPASDAATLRRQVAALQLDLEAHIESEKRLQGVNQQLRERLELYMQQNHENVERAESELNTLHEDMEQTLDLQRRLAQRATSLEKEKTELEQALQKCLQEFETERSSLQSRISKLSEELLEKSQTQARTKAIQAELELALVAKKQLEDELSSSCVQTDYLKHKAEEYSSELQTIMSKKQKDAIVEKSCRRNLLRRSLQNFREAIEEQRALCNFNLVAEEFSRTNSCRRGLRALQLAAKRSNKIRQAQDRLAKTGLEDCWRNWRLTTIVQKKYLTAVERKRQSFLWKSVSSWKNILDMGKMSKEEETYYTNVAIRQWRKSTCRRYLRHWRWWLRNIARPMRKKITKVQYHLQKHTRRHSFFAWKSAVRMKQIRTGKIQRAQDLGVLGCKRRAWKRWFRFLCGKKDRHRLLEKALRFRTSHRRKRAVVCWRQYVQQQKQKRLANGFAFRKYLHALISKGLNAWKQNVKYVQAEQRAIQEVNQVLKRATLAFWRDFLVVNAIKKKKEMKALVNKKRREKKAARAFLIFWWEEMAWRRRANQLAQLLLLRRHRSLLVNSLHGWIHATFDQLLVANVKFQNELFEAKALCDDQKQQTTAVDVENLQLIDRLHALSSEIALLKITISDKEKQEDDLRRALEDGAVIEGSLQGDLEQQALRIHELEMDVLSLQKKLQMKNLEDTAGEVHHTMELQNLERSLKDLQNQLAEKSSQLDSYERALKDTAEKLEGASDESQEKLTSAFEIAASLRRLLEDRETQYATLEGNCRRKELELNEVQRKLSAANSSFAETVDAREARIHELESILMQKQAEMQEAQTEFEELRKTLETKEGAVRRLEYEMKIKSDRDSQRAKAFVTSLTSWGETGSPVRNNLVHINESIRSVYNQARAALQENGATSESDHHQSNCTVGGDRNSRSVWLQRTTTDTGVQQAHSSSDDVDADVDVGDGDGDEDDDVDDDDGDGDEEGNRLQYVSVTTSDSCTRSSDSRKSSTAAEVEKNNNKGESLHEEIQLLQARIMSRLRDPQER